MQKDKQPDTSKSWLDWLAFAVTREPQDIDQLIDTLEHAKENHLLNADALKMIRGVLKVSDMHAREVMIPRPQMVVLNSEMTAEEALPIITESGHSRFPVVSDTRDEIIGVLMAKDLLKTLSTHNEKPTKIEHFIRQATFIPESKRLDILLKEFRLKRYHIAIIVDEYGSVCGLVTIEDLLEQIVGNIEDEYDTKIEEECIKAISRHEFLVSALTPLEEFNEYFKLSFEHDDSDTIGGFILHKMSHLPKQGESITIDSVNMTIVKTHSRRIQQIRVSLPKAEILE
ncbi:MAG: magnesium/cobalt efflux protein [Coxiellaceae bacterium]|nr:magnesium/cobalt efflux protein [Coxiellaceae bacterium]|tara:strand:- start:486 stop:1340 length:855 start_codon:yes stop_codon:yes gene_type:complete